MNEEGKGEMKMRYIRRQGDRVAEAGGTWKVEGLDTIAH